MPKNAAPTEKILISTTPQVAAILDWLVKRGTFGKNRAEAAERIVSERLREYLEDDKFEPKGADE